MKLSEEGTPTQTGVFTVYGRLTTLLSPSMITLTSLHSAFPLQSVNALWSNPSHSYALPLSPPHYRLNLSLSLSPTLLFTHPFIPPSHSFTFHCSSLLSRYPQLRGSTPLISHNQLTVSAKLASVASVCGYRLRSTENNFSTGPRASPGCMRPPMRLRPPLTPPPPLRGLLLSSRSGRGQRPG